MKTRRVAAVAAVSALALGAMLAGVAPAGDAPAKPPAVAAYDAAKTAAERTLNEAGYREHIQGWRTYLLHKHLGEWVVIAGGKAYPVNATGTAVRPAATMEEADAAARTAVPNARHRFVFRIGEDGGLFQQMGGAEVSHVLGNVFMAELERPDVEMKGLGSGQKIYFHALNAMHGERVEITARGPDDRMFMKPEVGAPGAAGFENALYVLSTGYAGCMTMSAETAATASLQLWEVPGTVTVEGAFQKGVCRRARARVRFPVTDLDFLIPVAVWPEKK